MQRMVFNMSTQKNVLLLILWSDGMYREIVASPPGLLFGAHFEPVRKW